MKLEDSHSVSVFGDGHKWLWMQCVCGWKGPKRPSGVVEDHVLEIDKLVHWVGKIRVEDTARDVKEAF